MTEADINLARVLAEHKLRRRSFLDKLILTPAAISSTGLLANVMTAGKAWGQAVPPTTVVTLPTTTQVTAPTTTLVTFPTTTLVTFPTTTLVTQPITPTVTTLVTFPPTTIFTLPVTDPVPNTVPEPSSAVLVLTGIAAAIAMTTRYRAAAERQVVADLDHDIADRPSE